MDFLNQFPPEVLALFVGLPIFMLILLIGILMTLRARRRNRDAAPAERAGSARQPARASQAVPEPFMEDDDPLDTMPDLELLAALEAAAPAPKPAPIQPSAPISPYHVVTDDVRKVRLATGHETQAVALLTVLRDERDGRLMIQMDDTAHRSLVDAPDTKRAFTQLMKELSGVITKPDAPSGDVRPQAAPPAKPASPPPTSTASQQPASTDDGAAVPTLGSMLSKKPQPDAPKPARDDTPAEAPEPAPWEPPSAQARINKAVGATLPGDLPSYRFDDIPSEMKGRRLGFGRVEADMPPIVDIPSAIEAYLQYKLTLPSEYEGRDFHVKPSPGGGVQILVDNAMYDSVDDIPDAGIRKFIRTAIDEWSERNM